MSGADASAQPPSSEPGQGADGGMRATAPSGQAVAVDAGEHDGGDAAAAGSTDLASANARWLPACDTAANQGGRASSIPTVKLDDATVEFPFRSVRALLAKGARPAIEQCVAAARKRSADLTGVVLVKFSLPDGGGLSNAQIVRGVGDGELHSCLLGALTHAKTPDLQAHGITLSNVPVVVCPNGRALFWPDPPMAKP